MYAHHNSVAKKKTWHSVSPCGPKRPTPYVGRVQRLPIGQHQQAATMFYTMPIAVPSRWQSSASHFGTWCRPFWPRIPTLDATGRWYLVSNLQLSRKSQQSQPCRSTRMPLRPCPQQSWFTPHARWYPQRVPQKKKKRLATKRCQKPNIIVLLKKKRRMFHRIRSLK